jgi:outer membrane protein
MNKEAIMNSARKRFGIALALCALFQAAQAQEVSTAQAAAPASPVSIDLNRVRELAAANSPTLKKFGLAVEASSISRTKQGLSALPSLSASAQGGLDLKELADPARAVSATIGLSISQSVWDGGKGGIENAIAALSTESARAEARAAYDSLMKDVDTAFFALLEAQAQVEAADDDLSNSKRNLELAQAKFAIGSASTLDLLKAESNQATKETALSKARGDLLVRRAKVASLISQKGGFSPVGLDFSSYEGLIAALAACSDEKTEAIVSAFILKAKAANPSLASSSIGATIAQKNVGLALAAYSPTVSAGLSPKLGIDAASGVSASASLSLAVSVPLDLWNTALDVKSKRTSAAQSGLDLENAASDLEIEVRSAVYDCLSQARSVISGQKAYEYASSYYSKSQELYALSAGSSVDLSDAQLVASTSRESLISARYGFLTSLSALGSLASLSGQAEIVAAITGEL